MKIIIAPDSFKGSIDSLTASRILSEAVRHIYPDAKILSYPLGDGGEGTLEILSKNGKCHKKQIECSDPLGRPITPETLFLEDGNAAYIESASICGLPLLTPQERNPFELTSFGLGTAIVKTLEHGVKRIYLGLGGTATVDGGIGMLSALGWRFIDENDNILKGKGKDLLKINRIHSPASPFDKQVEIIALCDVRNPLLGTQGAVNIFGPQKGLLKEDLPLAEKGMINFAEKTICHTQNNFIMKEGAGAAGGIGFALFSYLDATYRSGINFLMNKSGFSADIEGADLVITGEGCIDRQSLMGKVVGGILTKCLNKKIPVLAFGGKVKDREVLLKEGISGICPITPVNIPTDEAMKPEIAEYNLYTAALRFFNDPDKNFLGTS